MKKLKSLSAPVAVALAAGMLFALLPSTFVPAERTKWRMQETHSEPLAVLPAATARGLRGSGTEDHTGVIAADNVSYIRIAAPQI